MIKYLLDEHIPLFYRARLLQQSEVNQAASDLEVWVIGDPSAPPKGTPDPNVLRWCDLKGFALVTNNRRSMPVHLADQITFLLFA